MHMHIGYLIHVVRSEEWQQNHETANIMMALSKNNSFGWPSMPNSWSAVFQVSVSVLYQFLKNKHTRRDQVVFNTKMYNLASYTKSTIS